MKNLNFILEQVNGAASILTFSLLIVLTLYLLEWVDYKHKTTWQSILVGVPPAIALAFVLYVEKTGTLLTRMVVWTWRTFGHGDAPFTDTQTGFLVFGAVLTSVGLLLMIRLLTHYRSGNWPWVASASLVTAYLLVSSAAHFLT